MSVTLRTWSEEVRSLGERIASLSLAQARELSAYLKSVHGIVAAQPPVVVEVSDPPEIFPCPGPPTFRLVYDGLLAPSMKLTVCKLFRERFKLGLAQAKEWAESAPRTLAE